MERGAGRNIIARTKQRAKKVKNVSSLGAQGNGYSGWPVVVSESAALGIMTIKKAWIFNYLTL